jgi:hypothetical protein
MDLMKYERTRQRYKSKADKTRRQTLSNYRSLERYNLARYSVILDKDVKKRFMDFCLKNNLSTARIIQHLLVEFLDKQAPNG